jgi:3-dehydroquinate dehydratase
VRSIVTQELLNDAGFTHASGAVDDEAWHPVAGRIVDEIHQSFQNALGARILNPTLLAKPMNTISICQQCGFATRRLEMS